MRNSVGVTPISLAVGFSSAAPADVTCARAVTHNADTNATTRRR
jgi:hypothetical protein